MAKIARTDNSFACAKLFTLLEFHIISTYRVVAYRFDSRWCYCPQRNKTQSHIEKRNLFLLFFTDFATWTFISMNYISNIILEWHNYSISLIDPFLISPKKWWWIPNFTVPGTASYILRQLYLSSKGCSLGRRRMSWKNIRSDAIKL